MSATSRQAIYHLSFQTSPYTYVYHYFVMAMSQGLWLMCMQGKIGHSENVPFLLHPFVCESTTINILRHLMCCGGEHIFVLSVQFTSRLDKLY